MKGHPAILETLNAVLAGELVAINQYMMHAKLCESWGYTKLATKMRTESIDEMRHAEALMDRILLLEGLPNLQELGKLRIGETVKEQLECDLALEVEALARLRKGIAVCREQADTGSETLLQTILTDEEGHADWIETQLTLIEKLGEQLYLAQQLGA
jgi:bacterioferritin